MKKNTSRPAANWLALSVTPMLLALAACTPPAPLAAPVQAVKTQTVAASGALALAEYSGEVRARTESRLGFRVGGKITQRQAEVGQRVKAGQLLAQLDPQDFRLAADAARAQVAVARTSRDLAAADFKRYESLKAQSFISGAELERRDATLKAADAQLSQVTAQLAVQGNQAGYTMLRADAAGVVTAVEAEPGQVVAAGVPVVRVAVDGLRDVVFSVPEDRLASVPVGLPVALRVWAQGAVGALNQAALRGRVREVGAISEPLTRTYSVKVAIEAGTAPALGTTVYVTPDASALAGPTLIKLPTTALWRDGQATSVWVVDTATMTVAPQPIEIATADGNQVAVASGLQSGAVVVTAGVHVLVAGQKVSFYKPAPSAALK